MKTINVTRSSMPEYEEYINEIKSLWDTRWLSNNGLKYQEFERRLADYLDVKYVVMFSNGHLALEAALSVLDLEGEVITTPYTFISTVNAITRCGLKPVFCDVDANTGTLDVNHLETLITKKTRAIVPVHIYGNICNVHELDEIARKHDLRIVYDAAHAFGEKYRGKGIGNFGDMSMFSFHSTKVFHTIEGGVITLNDDNLYKKLRHYKNFGFNDERDVKLAGFNAKMNEFQAAMGICNLRYIDKWIQQRQTVNDLYMQLLGGNPSITTLQRQKDVECNYSYFPIWIEPNGAGVDRDYVFEKLKENGINSRKYFYPLCSEFSYYKDDHDSSLTQNALSLSKSVLCLPMYSDLLIDDARKICNVVLKCFDE